jgi:hypothetical protein
MQPMARDSGLICVSQEMGTSLIFARPEDPNAHLIDLLKKKQSKGKSVRRSTQPLS